MRLVKKIKLVVVLAAAFLLAIFITSQITAAAEGLKLSVERQSGNVGGQAIVKITAENATGSEGGQFLLSFDPDFVRPVLAEAGELVTEAESSQYMVNLDYARGQLMFMWVTVFADTADSGIVCMITFDLLKEGETQLRITDVVVAPAGFEVAQAASGGITIGDAGEDVGVDQEDNDNGDLDQDEESDGVINGNEQWGNDEDNFPANPTENASTKANLYLLIGLAVVVAAVGFVIFKRLKKPGV